MRCVRSKDTAPEIKVRSLLHRLGFRFTLHRRDLPGRPDIVLPKYSTVVFVHGCFWHRHPRCPNATKPATRQDYWLPKFNRTVTRDQRNQEEIRRRGWSVVVVWECELRDTERLTRRLRKAIASRLVLYQQLLSTVELAAESPMSYGTNVDHIEIINSR